MKNYLKMLKFLRGHMSRFSWAVVFMLFASVFEVFQLGMAMPMIDIIFTRKKVVVPNNLAPFIQDFVSQLNGVSPEQMFKVFPFILVGGILFKQLFTFVHKYLMNDVSQRIILSVRDRIYGKIQELSLDYFSEKRTGELISRITFDVNIIEGALSYGLTDLFKQTFLIMMYVTSAFLLFPRAALVIFVVFPIIALPLSSIGKKLRKLSKRSQEKMADISSLLIETLSGIRLIKAFHTEEYEKKRFNHRNYDFYKVRMKSIKRSLAIAPITEIFGGCAGAIVFIWLGGEVMAEKVSLGVFISFFGCVMSIISPVKKLGNVNASIQQALSANERIYEILDAEVTVKEKNNATIMGNLKNGFVLENVDFRYAEDSGWVLKNINLEIKKGELVAIVGPTGTGKSTLANLMPRFYDVSQGAVKIDGVDVKDISLASLRGQFGIVTQETILFNDTVRANISYGRMDASLDDVEDAAKKAFAHRFIKDLPKGYDTVIGERGFRLSGGEKQRLAIARAILKNSPVLILDEATSQLDTESEKFVQEALDKLMMGRTVIAIAHRLSTIMKADKIIVLNEGYIVGMGTHQNLLKTCKLYQRLQQNGQMSAG